MNISVNTHTILMLVGPTECGKSTFAKEILMPQLKAQLQMNEVNEGLVHSNVQYLSSDEIRQELLGYDYDKYDQVMLEASSGAFHMLFEKLKAVTSFPIQAPFVIVDTTGLADDFREKVRSIAKENHYNLDVILFDYRDRKDYYASERSKRIITAHLNRMRKEVLGSLAREGYHQIHKVRAKDFLILPEGKQQSEVSQSQDRDQRTEYDQGQKHDLVQVNPAYCIDITNIALYHKTYLPLRYNYIVIGDVHETVDSLVKLLERYGYSINEGKLTPSPQVENTRIVLAGDWIDKGKQTREIVNFLYENKQVFYFVLGNHENFVYKYLQGELKGIDQELLHSYFDSILVLRADNELRAKFNHLCELSMPFYTRQGASYTSFYVTHAPCHNKYIGKLDAISIKHQRNFRLDRSLPTEEQITFIKEEAVSNHPFHIFGHIAAKQAFRIKNKVHIDTGAVYGNKLTGVEIAHKPFFKSVACNQDVTEKELPTLFERDKQVKIHDLADADLRRLAYCSHNQVNFISGTMSPADKNEETGELESLQRGLDYFKSHGVNTVVLQPKYMGSRCNIYLHRDAEASYAVSRNGYRIKGLDLSVIYGQLLNKFSSFMEDEGLSVMVLDGELLPWRAMGAGLIERQFKSIERGLGLELDFLAQHGFDDALSKLIAEYEASGFKQEQFKLSKSVLNEKYGSAAYQTYKHVGEITERHIPVAEQQVAYEVYKKQLELYAPNMEKTLETELHYKPFSILKFIYQDGSERLPDWTTSRMYSFLSDDEFIVLDLQDSDSYTGAQQYFSTLTTTKSMEGVVIKPEYVSEDVVPYMKVRNGDYLTIVYGYDYRFPHKYKKLFKQKSIHRKLKTSLNEHALGQQMLGVKLADISPDNEVYKRIAANLLFEVASEKEIDPRL